MIRYQVSQGDCASSIAAKFRFRDFRTIWDDPSNHALRVLRLDPNILFPGDTVVIPDREERVEEAATGQRHVYVARNQTTMLRLRIETGRSVDYELVIDGGDPVRGTTDGRAPIVHPISARSRSGVLTLWPSSLEEQTSENGMAIPIALGALDPIDELAGVQGRLRNLGFYDGPIDNLLEAPTREAIRAFQRFLSKPPTGEPTPEVRADLVAHHDVA